jgi:hypothetical protein
MLNIQFSDSTKTVIATYFGNPQDPDIYSNQGQVSTADPMWRNYYSSLPASVQQWLPQPT